jgi:sialate O-acetylesterase
MNVKLGAVSLVIINLHGKITLRTAVEALAKSGRRILGNPVPILAGTSPTIGSCARSSPLTSWLLLVSALTVFSPAVAMVRLPGLISDNMVLQQGKKVAIWGNADPDEQVTLTFDGQTTTAKANDEGRWKIELGPLRTSGPLEMTITGKNTITLHNVVVGEVWICSGQSNMDMMVQDSMNAEKEISTAYYPMVRQFTVKKVVASGPQEDVQGRWVLASPVTVGKFSAVAYFFGRELIKTLNVPIGLIDSSWGGTPAEAWTSASALNGDPELKPLLDAWQKDVADYSNVLEHFRHELEEWERLAEKAESEGKPIPPPQNDCGPVGQYSPCSPQLPGDPRTNAWRATGLYNAMIAPLTTFAIAGVIWYQGESNATFGSTFAKWRPPESDKIFHNRSLQYRRLFPALIRDWRQRWGEGDFPFLFVQLANWNQNYAPKNSWAELRESQATALSLPKTGMAVTIDIGDPENVHPKNKQEVGRRLALAAEAIAYGRKIVYSGPMYESMSIARGSVLVHFRDSDGGLVARDGPLKGFEIAGEDREFHHAEARIDGSTIVVQSSEVPRPVAVRYAWADNPECSLYDESGLPASPFRTDNWPTRDHDITPGE